MQNSTNKDSWTEQDGIKRGYCTCKNTNTIYPTTDKKININSDGKVVFDNNELNCKGGEASRVIEEPQAKTEKLYVNLNCGDEKIEYRFGLDND